MPLLTNKPRRATIGPCALTQNVSIQIDSESGEYLREERSSDYVLSRNAILKDLPRANRGRSGEFEQDSDDRRRCNRCGNLCTVRSTQADVNHFIFKLFNSYIKQSINKSYQEVGEKVLVGRSNAPCRPGCFNLLPAPDKLSSQRPRASQVGIVGLSKLF